MSLNAGKDVHISLLNITQKQAAAFVRLLDKSEFGFEMHAKWHLRKPVLSNLLPLAAPLCSDIQHDMQQLILKIGPGDEKFFQKQIKAFGNRLASAARRPVRFERVYGNGRVHIAPAFHSTGACNTVNLTETTTRDSTCVHCILAALTPPVTDGQGEFHPYGRTKVSDAELFFLRDQAAASQHQVVQII